jgi:hypothetical protein
LGSFWGAFEGSPDLGEDEFSWVEGEEEGWEWDGVRACSFFSVGEDEEEEEADESVDSGMEDPGGLRSSGIVREEISSPSSARIAMICPTGIFWDPEGEMILPMIPSSWASTSMVALSVSYQAYRQIWEKGRTNENEKSISIASDR